MTETEMEQCEVQNHLLVVEREDLKKRMEFILAKVKSSVSPSFVKDKLAELKTYLKALEKTDKNILSNIVKFKTLKDFYNSERDTAYEYKLELEEQIAILSDNLAKGGNLSLASEDSVPQFSSSHAEVNSNASDRSISSLNILRSAKEPPIEIGKFEGNEQDKLAFSRFLAKFNAVIDGNHVYSKEEKFIHLITNLGQEAYDMVKHLSLEGSNYPIALDILKSEYFDKEFIVEKIFMRILDISLLRKRI